MSGNLARRWFEVFTIFRFIETSVFPSLSLFSLTLYIFIVTNSFLYLTIIMLKANMNSDIPLQTAVIFFSNKPLSETGYWQGVCYA